MRWGTLYPNRWGGSDPFRRDPGPCIVDDTPHCACTPESVGLKQAQQQAQQQAAKNGADSLPVSPPPPAPATALPAEHAGSFTTKDYKRTVHGRKPATRAG